MPQASIGDRGLLKFADEVTYGVDPLAGYETYQPKAMPDTGNLKPLTYNDERMVVGNYRLSKVIGRNSDATLSCEWWVRGYRALLPTHLPQMAAANPDIRMIGHSMGGLYAAPGVAVVPTVEAAPAPSVTEFTLSSAAELAIGELCVLHHAALATYEVCRIKNIAGAVITLTSPLRDVPVAGDFFHGSLTAWQTDYASSSTLTAHLHTTVSDGALMYQIHKMHGMRASSAKLTWTAGEFCSLSVDFMIADFTSAFTEADPPVFVADTFPPRQAIVGARLYWKKVGAADSGCFEASSVEVDLGLDVKRPLMMCGDVQGTGNPQFGIHNPSITINPLLREDFATRALLGDKFDLLLQIGNQPGNMVLMGAANCGFDEIPTTTSDDQLARQSIVFRPEIYTGDGASSTLRGANALTPEDASIAIAIA